MEHPDRETNIPTAPRKISQRDGLVERLLNLVLGLLDEFVEEPRLASYVSLNDATGTISR